MLLLKRFLLLFINLIGSGRNICWLKRAQILKDIYVDSNAYCKQHISQVPSQWPEWHYKLGRACATNPTTRHNKCMIVFSFLYYWSKRLNKYVWTHATLRWIHAPSALCRSKLHDESRSIQGVLMITKMMTKSLKVKITSW